MPNSDPQIEVTEEMLDAGVKVLWDSGAVEVSLESDREVIRDVFQAMLQASFSAKNKRHSR